MDDFLVMHLFDDRSDTSNRSASEFQTTGAIREAIFDDCLEREICVLYHTYEVVHCLKLIDY